MAIARTILVSAVLMAPALLLASQAPTSAAPAQPPAPRPGTPAPGGPRRAPVQVMTLTTSAWTDGGTIPLRYTQAGEEISPPFAWSNVPDNTASFVLIARDLDAAVGSGSEDVLHWLLWNIPATTRSLAEAMPQGSQLPDGTRQISVSGPYYRGPGAPRSGPPHHYTFELYALDSMLDVAAVGQTPSQTRAAVLAAMAGKVRGKAACVGTFRR